MIHPTAIVDPKAELGPGVEVGAYAVIRAGAVIGAGTRVGEHALVEGPCVLGAGNVLHPYAVVGTAPQDLKYAGEPTRLEMGEGNVVREFVTLNRGTVQGGGVTRIGDRNLFMAFSHVAHDCTLGSSIVMANGTALAGHVTIESFVVVGGVVGIHQYVRIGESAMVAGGSMVGKDVPPFAMVQGDRARLVGVNTLGLKRRGFTEDDLEAVGQSMRLLIKSKTTFENALKAIDQAHGANPRVAQMLTFLRVESHRGIMFRD